jgi:predicted  nucleic acid-binding Zn-ribbon protein
MVSACRPVMLLFALLFVGASANVGAVGNKVTPVEKVIELLANLEKKVEAEGKEEAAQYDKYACFCKEQADEKTYAIEQSEKKIAELTAEIDELKAEINTLNGDISKLSKKISGLSAAIQMAEAKREAEHETYVEKEADASGAISAVERALEALKSSKGNMGGKTAMENLLQVRSVAALALGLKSTLGDALSAKQWKTMAAVAQPGSGEAAQYEYHSNDIIATLESLLQKFTTIKNDLDQEEFDLRSAFEKNHLGLSNERKFAEKEKAEKEALMEKKTEQKEASEDERSKEAQDKASDEDFRAVLTEECQLKAQVFDQRSNARAAELTAIAEAMDTLKKGVQPNYGANKKLNGLIQMPTVPKGHWAWVEDKPASFLQLRGSKSAPTKAELAQKAQAFLMLESSKLNSPVLSALAMKVHSPEDHFVKVRTLIKDLLSKLKSDAEAEATQKGFCDKEMSKAINQRDEQQGIVESSTAALAMMEAKVQQLTEEIAELSQQISDNKKALNEATELREEEKAENEVTVADATAGKAAVESAISVLKGFYENAFVQVKYTPPNSDRSGKTVSDLAPETFANDKYSGSQDSSKGIIGLLEVILSDFDRSIAAVTDEEETNQGEYDKFKQENEDDTEEKENSVTKKQGTIKDTESDIVDMKDALSSADESLKSALSELEKLHSMCVAGEESYAERVAQRNKEIAALKEAHSILEDWQGL